MCKDHNQHHLHPKPYTWRHSATAVIIPVLLLYSGILLCDKFNLTIPWFSLIKYTTFTTIILFIFMFYKAHTTTIESQPTQQHREKLSKDPEQIEIHQRLSSQKQQLAERLATVVKIPTISYDKHDSKNKTDHTLFLQMHRTLQQLFPAAHKVLKRTVINEYSLLYEWTGSNTTLKPYLLCGHMDVVPTPQEDQWEFHPFSGEIKNGYVHGRGTIDDKQYVCGLLEAIEDLAKQNWKPERSIYLAFGHDEEIGKLRI